MLDLWIALFGILATIVGGVWTAFVYFDKKRSAETTKEQCHTVYAEGGIASGRDTVVHGNVFLNRLPKSAIALMALGLLVLAWAISKIGDDVNTYNLANYSVAKTEAAISPIERNLIQNSVEAFVSVSGGRVIDVSLSELAGRWSSKWRRTGSGWYEGNATASTANGQLRFDYADETGAYVLEARPIGQGILIGRYQNLGVNSDSTNWVGFIVSPNEIRGYYAVGVWDFWKP